MNHQEFMTAVTAYYGPYLSELVERVVFKYVKQKFQEEQLQNIFSQLTFKLSNKFKTPPDVAAFEELFGNEDDRIEIQANEIWNEICNKSNAYADIIFADAAAFLAFRNATGGLVNFSLREREEEVWIKKRFIELYKLYVKNPPRDVRPVMRGLANRSGNGSQPVMIGDKNKCKQIAENNSNYLIYDLTKNLKTMEVEV